MTTNDPGPGGDYPSGQPYSQPPIWQSGAHLPPPYPPPPTGPGKRSWFARHKVLTGLLALVALLVVLGGIGAAIGGQDPDPAGSKPITAATSSATSTPAATQETTPPPPPPVNSYGEPKASDFTLSVRTTSKECFGEAGCIVEYKVTAKYDGPELDPSKSYDVTYHVSGPEDGGQDDTFTVTGDSYELPLEQSAQTPSSGTRLRVKVTGVSES